MYPIDMFIKLLLVKPPLEMVLKPMFQLHEHLFIATPKNRKVEHLEIYIIELPSLKHFSAFVWGLL